MIADLRDLHHRRAEPAGNDIGLNDPTDRALGLSLRNLAAEHEPSVIVVHAPVVELERRALAFNREAAVCIVRSAGKALSHSIGFRNQVVCHDGIIPLVISRKEFTGNAAFRHRELAGVVVIGLLAHRRAVGLAREDALLAVHDPRLAEQLAGEQLHVEAELPCKFRRHRAVEIHRHHKIFLPSLHADAVGKLQIGIDHRVKAL